MSLCAPTLWKGADAAQKLQIPVVHVFVAKHRVQKMLQDEVRMLRKARK
jgi:hypothetical protein